MRPGKPRAVGLAVGHQREASSVSLHHAHAPGRGGMRPGAAGPDLAGTAPADVLPAPDRATACGRRPRGRRAGDVHDAGRRPAAGMVRPRDAVARARDDAGVQRQRGQPCLSRGTRAGVPPTRRGPCCCSTTADTATAPARRTSAASRSTRARRAATCCRALTWTPPAWCTSESRSARPSRWTSPPSIRPRRSSCGRRSRRWPTSGSYHYPILPVRLLLRDRYAAIDRIAQVRAPLLVIAGDADTIVPLEQSRRVHDAARSPKAFVVIEGADHNDAALTAGPIVVAETMRITEPTGRLVGSVLRMRPRPRYLGPCRRSRLASPRYTSAGATAAGRSNQPRQTEHGQCQRRRFWNVALHGRLGVQESSMTTMSSLGLPSTPLATRVLAPEVRRTRLMRSPALATAPRSQTLIARDQCGPRVSMRALF